MTGLSLLLSLSLLSLFLSPALCLTCTSQKFTNKVYANCIDLPRLGAYLHYTYNASNSSLAIAYLAAPASYGKWVAWAINPVSTGMIGAQALMALRLDNGSLVAKTYNCSSYIAITESKLSFEVWDLSADEANGKMRVFASVKVPKDATSVNQVWNVGGAVIGNQPQVHSLSAANRESKGKLTLVSSRNGGGIGTATAPAPGPSNGGWRVDRNDAGFFISLILFIGVTMV
ncbi:cytochrome b561 and DOMON domain-containing protein At3g25290-like [Syzygium oleosum]|uniref:cytochrome b561 and DOMON domain-containing protein At3g25290-like n=1 Tax=Syzygium oleosum TaxID=219896 RepID=UPI0011D191D1|nr:cytochrome b561 and DOMON domain-containing protein At3g25290-like [Syzygium oleosum]